MLGAALGFRLRCVACQRLGGAQAHPRRLRRAVIWTDPADGSDGAIRTARALAAAEPERYLYADQYGNEQNWKAHYRTTANEIWKQTDGQVTHFVAGLAPAARLWHHAAAEGTSTKDPVHLHAAGLAFQRFEG